MKVDHVPCVSSTCAQWCVDTAQVKVRNLKGAEKVPYILHGMSEKGT